MITVKEALARFDAFFRALDSSGYREQEERAEMNEAKTREIEAKIRRPIAVKAVEALESSVRQLDQFGEDALFLKIRITKAFQFQRRHLGRNLRLVLEAGAFHHLAMAGFGGDDIMLPVAGCGGIFLGMPVRVDPDLQSFFKIEAL